MQVVLLLPHSARGKALEPAFALAGQPVTLHASVRYVPALAQLQPAPAVLAGDAQARACVCTLREGAPHGCPPA